MPPVFTEAEVDVVTGAPEASPLACRQRQLSPIAWTVEPLAPSKHTMDV